VVVHDLYEWATSLTVGLLWWWQKIGRWSLLETEELQMRNGGYNTEDLHSRQHAILGGHE